MPAISELPSPAEVPTWQFSPACVAKQTSEFFLLFT
jgi:hypothetical protein